MKPKCNLIKAYTQFKVFDMVCKILEEAGQTEKKYKFIREVVSSCLYFELLDIAEKYVTRIKN